MSATRDIAIIDLSNSTVKRTLRAFINKAEGLFWFEMRRCRAQRSLQQNAFFHSACVPAVAKRLTELWGETVDVAQAKQFLKDKFLRRPVIDKETGEVRGYVTLDTHALDEGEFKEFLDAVIDFAVRDLELPPELFEARPRAEREPAVC